MSGLEYTSLNNIAIWLLDGLYLNFPQVKNVKVCLPSGRDAAIFRVAAQ